MWELDYKDSWALKNWCFWSVVLDKILESPLDCKEIQPVNPKGNQSWIFIGRIDAEAPILWPPDAKKWFNWKDPDAGKDWGQKEKGNTGDEMVGWHHELDGHEFEQALGVGDGQGGLVCCSPWGHKESDTAEQPNWTESVIITPFFKIKSAQTTLSKTQWKHALILHYVMTGTGRGKRKLGNMYYWTLQVIMQSREVFGSWRHI